MFQKNRLVMPYERMEKKPFSKLSKNIAHDNSLSFPFRLTFSYLILGILQNNRLSTKKRPCHLIFSFCLFYFD